MDRKLSIAKKLLQIKAIKLSPQNPFTWTSGMRSPIYCDNRITLSYPEVRSEIKEGLKEVAAELGDFQHVSGVATAGIAHGALLAEALDLPFSYIRSSAKKHGRKNQIEGEINTNHKILVVEDLISTGGSSIEAVEVLRNEGYEVAGVVSIFNYGFQKAKDAFAKANCPYVSILDYPTLLNIARENEYITKEENEALDTWNKDPQAWSDQF